MHGDVLADRLLTVSFPSICSKDRIEIIGLENLCQCLLLAMWRYDLVLGCGIHGRVRKIINI